MSSTPDDRARVLVLIKGLGIGGAERLISEGSEHWDRERFDYRVAYFLPWKDHLVGHLQSNGVVVDCIGSDKGLGPRAYGKLRSLISRWEPDIIHTHLPTAGIMARLATSRPVVHTEHNLVGSYRQPTRSANRLTYGRNAAVIAVSDAVAQSLHGYPGPAPRVIAERGFGFGGCHFDRGSPGRARRRARPVHWWFMSGTSGPTKGTRT